MPDRPRVWYVPLEPTVGRYTGQLGTRWMPTAVDLIRSADPALARWQWAWVWPTDDRSEQPIRTGRVLDGIGRGTWSVAQVSRLLLAMADGAMHDGDVILLADLWTPGIEAVAYAAHLANIRLRWYATCWAQTFDEYDFTAPMRPWMRPYEMMLDALCSDGGVFVASTLLRDLMRASGWRSPIHVVGLPFDANEVRDRVPRPGERDWDAVVFASRLDAEKQPEWMCAVADAYLRSTPTGTWRVVHPHPTLRGSTAGIAAIQRTAATWPGRFIVSTNTPKHAYYRALAEAGVVFNCSLQDWVSYTLLEAAAYGCELAYPRFRSFPDVVPAGRMYEPWEVPSALAVIDRARTERRTWSGIAWTGNRALVTMLRLVMAGEPRPDVNVWDDMDWRFGKKGPMYTITKEYSFDAAHHLDAMPEDHKCRRMHGHTYRVRVTVSAPYLDIYGMVYDYGGLGLASFRSWLMATCDHRDLNVAFPEMEGQTTAERLAERFWEAVTTSLYDAVGPAPAVLSVAVSETPATWATFTAATTPDPPTRSGVAPAYIGRVQCMSCGDMTRTPVSGTDELTRLAGAFVCRVCGSHRAMVRLDGAA